MLTELDHKILQTVFQEGEPISSKRLAMLCGASVNTIRKEISVLNREMEGQGLRIEMKSSVGAYPVILDTKRAIPYISKLRTFYQRSLHMEKPYSARVNALARRCLCAGDGLTVERLCEEFFSSRSTILRELEEVRELLSRFHLYLKNHRGSQGLTVEGSEWNIRQCLVYQHKTYMISGDDDRENYPGQQTFRTLFLMDEEIHESIFALVISHLLREKNFSLPSLHVPKLSNMLLLCCSRHKKSGQLSFTDQQLSLVKDTPEYQFILTLCEDLPARFRDYMGEMEKAALAMILLGFDEQSRGGEKYKAETEEFISYLCSSFGYAQTDFDPLFQADFSDYLSRLENRRIFGLFEDPEPVGQIRHLGITSANVCLAFARFYRQRHGISLTPTDTIGCFYILHRALNYNNTHQYSAQRVLVVSELGLDSARAMAARLMIQHGKEIREICPLSYGEAHRHWGESWDLLVTDMPEHKFRKYFIHCPIPILPVEFQLFEPQSETMEAYINQIKQQKQLEIIRADSFFRTDLSSKEEVFSFLEEQLAGDDLSDLAPISAYMRENDTLMDMERGNRLVFLPVFAAKDCLSRVVVLLNKEPIVWNRRKAQIFVCCVYNDSLHDGKVMASILHRFLYMAPEIQQELLRETAASPLLTLYPDE